MATRTGGLWGYFDAVLFMPRIQHRSLIADLESGEISRDPVDHGLLKSLKDPENVKLLLLLADVLPHVSALSLFFQRKNIHLGMMKTMVNKTLRILDCRMTADGPWLQKSEKLMQDCGILSTNSPECFSKNRTDFIQALKDHIEARFQDTDGIDSLAILDLKDQEDIPTFFGDKEIEALGQYFGLETETLCNQWHGFLELVKLSSAPTTMDNFLQILYGKSQADTGLLAQFPLIAQLVATASVLPLNTAEVERVISQLKLIKTDHRCSLSTKRVEQILNIKLNCSDVSSITQEVVKR